ncbi:unnamed protein product [Ectocarpus sp. 4 AP-2014]
MSYAVSRGGGAGGPNGLLPEYNSIVGAWVLEVSRSETMEGYLRCMNVADLAIEAQMKAEQDHESRNVFAIEGTKLVIHKRTKINHFTQIYELDKEKITDGRSGPKHCMVSLRNPGCLDGLVLTTSMPTAQGQMHLVETRQLLDKGHVHAQSRGSSIYGRVRENCGSRVAQKAVSEQVLGTKMTQNRPVRSWKDPSPKCANLMFFLSTEGRTSTLARKIKNCSCFLLPATALAGPCRPSAHPTTPF